MVYVSVHHAKMATGEFHLDTRIRRCHIPLATQQHRLRHLRSLSARNIILGNHDYNSVGLYFTLHHRPETPSFYISEVINENMNPSWKHFETCNFSSDVNTASPYVTVKVWTASHSKQLLIEWVVYFSGLSYLGELVPKEGKNFKPNTLLFGMVEGYYGCGDCFQHNLTDSTESSIKESIAAEYTNVRMSCTVYSLSRIKTIETATKQTQAAVRRNRSKIEKRLQGSDKLHLVYAERELVRIKISILQNELLKQEHKVFLLEKESLNQQEKIQYKRNELNDQYKNLEKQKEKLLEMGRCFSEFREMLLKTDAQLTFRRKLLISELAAIYHIAQFPDQKGYSVHHVLLPNSEKFSGHDETMISVAIGYVCHVVLMISQFLNVPLRYAIKFYGSRSTIIDHITIIMPARDREFPLYSKGKDRKYFEYGVYLLNKNIAQLRAFCGLTTKDLSATLPNLSNLIELRLSHSDPYLELKATLNVINERYSFASNKPDIDSGKVMLQNNSVNTTGAEIQAIPVCSSEVEYLKKEVEEMMPGVSKCDLNSVSPSKPDISNNLSCSLDKGLNDIKALQESFGCVNSDHEEPQNKLAAKFKKLGQGNHHSSFPNLTSNIHAFGKQKKINSSENSPSATTLMVLSGKNSLINFDNEQMFEASKSFSSATQSGNSCFYTSTLNCHVREQQDSILLPENTLYENHIHQMDEVTLDDQISNADLTLRTELLANRSSSFQMQRINPSDNDIQHSK